MHKINSENGIGTEKDSNYIGTKKQQKNGNKDAQYNLSIWKKYCKG